MGEFLAILSLVTNSLNIVLTKVASERANHQLGFLISVTVNVLFASLLFGIQFLYQQESIDWNTLGFFLFLSTGFFNIFLGRWTFFDAIIKLGPAKASAFQVSNPLFTFLIAWIFLGELLTPVNLIGIILSLFGLFLLSYVPQAFQKRTAVIPPEDNVGGIEQKQAMSAKRINVKKLVQSGVFLALLSAASYGTGNVFRGIAVQNWNEPILGSLIGSAFGMILHVVFSSTGKDIRSQLKRSDRVGVILFAMSGILTTSAHVTVISAMHHIPISIANLIFMSTPVIVIPLSYFVLKNKEGITIRTIVGSVMILFGISMMVL